MQLWRLVSAKSAEWASNTGAPGRGEVPFQWPSGRKNPCRQ